MEKNSCAKGRKIILGFILFKKFIYVLILRKNIQFIVSISETIVLEVEDALKLFSRTDPVPKVGILDPLTFFHIMIQSLRHNAVQSFFFLKTSNNQVLNYFCIK